MGGGRRGGDGRDLRTYTHWLMNDESIKEISSQHLIGMPCSIMPANVVTLFTLLIKNTKCTGCDTSTDVFIYLLL